jgi:hypothetical protein
MNFKLSDVCQIYVNRKMTQKLLHLNADEVFVNPDTERKLLEKCKNIEVHSVLLSCESIRKQFYMVVYPIDDKFNQVAFYLFKKKYDPDIQKYISHKGICKKSFIIDFNLPVSDNKNWVEIHNKNVEWEEISINMLEEHNIKISDFPAYTNLYNHYLKIDFSVPAFWGEVVSLNNIDWLLTIENIFKRDYGNENKEIPKYQSFTKQSINQIYYPYYNLNCYIYQYIQHFSIFKCDMCDRLFRQDQRNKDIWHNSDFGDLCHTCYLKIKDRHFKKISKIKKKLLQWAQKKIYLKNLERTKEILDHKKLPIINLNKKNSIYQNVIRELVKNPLVESCGICLDKMYGDIKAGSCGHCFHAKCIESILDDKCPMCRKKTDFIKIHI